MSNVTLVTENGKPSKSKKGSYIFCKEGVYFSLSIDQMKQLQKLINELIVDNMVAENNDFVDSLTGDKT